MIKDGFGEITLPTGIAATRRAMLANAHHDWLSTKDRDEADIALEATLLATQTITEEDVVESIHKEGTTVHVTVLTEAGIEAIEIDAHGNVIRGLID